MNNTTVSTVYWLTGQLLNRVCLLWLPTLTLSGVGLLSLLFVYEEKLVGAVWSTSEFESNR